jgi:hypothetical protein
VIAEGFEPSTYCLEGSCSIQLSYATLSFFLEGAKIENYFVLNQKNIFLFYFEPIKGGCVLGLRSPTKIKIMKSFNQITVIALFALIFTQTSFYSQSISGNLNSSSTKGSLSYGNVDIYKGDKLVASVLTDREGNFTIKLDTGTYRCEIQYAGYEKEVREIKVKRDEKADFSMKVDEKSKYRATTTSSTTSNTTKVATTRDDVEEYKKKGHYPSSTSHTHSLSTTKSTAPAYGGTVSHGYVSPGYDRSTETYSIAMPGEMPATSTTGRSGVLTAGEINDFSKWTLWKDIAVTKLKEFSNFWKVAPKGRYVLQLVSNSGLPIVDAKVKLLTKSNTLLYQSRTDNTGKSELWVDLSLDSSKINEKLQIEVLYNGKTEVIRNAKPFEQGLNTLKIEATCQQINNVDIAFVVDATGSMGDEINFLKAELNEVIFKSKEISTSLNFRFASVFYRDHGDEYLTRTMNFSRVLSESISFITDQRAGGGGDYEEAVEIGLDSAINKLNWSEEARARILFLILDAPPHNTDAIRISLQKSMRLAAEKGIRIVPLVASGINKPTEYLMRCMALATNGTYVFLTDHSGVGGAHLKPTTDKYDVELLSELMVRVLKSYTYMPDCNQQMPELNLPYTDSVVVYPNQEQPIVKDTLTPKKDTVITVETQISWKFFPNPTRDFITILTDRDVEELYITDLSGKALQIIYKLQKDNPVRVDLSEYPSGIYLIRYPIDKVWVTGKVVLAR